MLQIDQEEYYAKRFLSYYRYTLFVFHGIAFVVILSTIIIITLSSQTLVSRQALRHGKSSPRRDPSARCFRRVINETQ